MKDSATLNITKLYRGFYDSFQITSSQWLVDNKWLLPSQADKVMYIKSFELFLPTVSEESVTFVSKSFASGEVMSKILRNVSGTNGASVAKTVPLKYSFNQFGLLRTRRAISS